ncbi:hypothetical protein VB780_19425 [Leptolyngbya sp. CCNP1308]|uniref:hypothetical protein n=1 Tax=Leptolyngbya sp. CCNP1308 TaxID=3110255 RepID=UPI002B2098A8|nr:hypothetical protein [Leptolyngbya sp. CCNP1308]MEA5450760.1 hypothetical protein [Leptolyngbya sp. CCNP1308]
MNNCFTVLDAVLLGKLTRFSEKERCQILEKISLLSKDPFPDGHSKRQLVHQNHKIYRMRSGRYRIIYCLEKPYIGIIAILSRDDETYEQAFLPTQFNQANEITDYFEHIDAEFLKLLAENDLQVVRDKTLKSISQLRQKQKSLSEREENFTSDERALHSLADELNLQSLDLKLKREALEKREGYIKYQEKKIAKEKLEASDLSRKLGLARKVLIEKRNEIAEKYKNIDRDREVAIEEAKSLVTEKIAEARKWIDSIMPPPPLSVVVSQKPDERVLSLPEAAKFKYDIPFQPNDKASIYLFIVGSLLILMPWSSLLKFFLFLSGSMFLLRRSFEEARKYRKEFARWCIKTEENCTEYEKIRNLVLVSYFDQLEISKATQSGTEDFVKRVEWWRKESSSIVLGEINHALEEAANTLNKNQNSR